MALQIPRVDYSVYNQARQTNYDIEFAKLREEERKNNKTAALIQGGFQLAGLVGNVLKEADLEKNKAAVADAEAKIQEAAMQAIANNDFTEISDENGQTRIELGQSYKETIAQLKADLPQSAFLPSTKKWIDSTLSAADNQARLGALNFAYTQFAKQRDAAAQENLASVITGSSAEAARAIMEIDSGPDVDENGLSKEQRRAIEISKAFENVKQTIDSRTWESSDNKARIIKSSLKAFGLETSINTVKAKVAEGGLAAGTDWLDKETGWAGADRATILAAGGQEADLAQKAAIDRANTAFDAALADGRSPVEAQAVFASLPPAFRGDAQANFYDRQAKWAHNQTMEELTQVKTLGQLQAVINRIRTNGDGRYYGEEGAQTWAQQEADLRRAEGMVSFFGGGGSDKDNAESEKASSIIRRMLQGWQAGEDGQTGYGIIKEINEYENKRIFSSDQANKLRAEVTGMKFPAAAPAFENMRQNALAYLGLKETPSKPLSAEDGLRVDRLESTMNMFLADKLMEYGGNVNPAVIERIMDRARQVVVMKEFDEVSKRLFDKEVDPLLRAIRATDSAAGRDAVFTDFNQKVQFLTSGAEKVYESRAAMEVEYLGKLGVKVVSSSAEPEDARGFDITGAKIHQGEDGKQYRLAESGGKIMVLSRSGSGGEWKEREPPKAPAAPPAGPAAKPAASAGDLTKVSGVDKYLDTDISATWEKATKGIAGRDRMMLPTTKKAQIAWLIKQGYLSE